MESGKGDAPRVFLSHASEDKDVVRKLNAALGQKGIKTWFDEAEIRTGDSIFQKINDGLRLCTHFAIVLSPQSIDKPWVKEELGAGFIRALNAEAKLLPILYDLPSDKLPPLIQGRRWFALDRGALDPGSENISALIADIRGTPITAPLGARPEVTALLGELHNTPSLPATFVDRPETLDRLRSCVLAENPTAIGVWGMGGAGKTVLTASFVRDEMVRRAFPDGVFWISLKQPPDLPARQSDLLFLITGEKETFIDTETGKTRLGEALKSRRCLVVLDNVWTMDGRSGRLPGDRRPRPVAVHHPGRVPRQRPGRRQV